MNPITNARAEKLTIGELSGLTAVNIETIRYYERIKMLPAPKTGGLYITHFNKAGRFWTGHVYSQIESLPN